MEHLTKQQIVLLTLFTSFVTSIATGIVTVALVDQAPAGVTNTIDHVIERTVEEVGPPGTVTGTSNTQSASVSDAASGAFSDPADQIADATSVAQKSVVHIVLGNNVTGLGVVVASSGVIISDKSAVAQPGNYIAVTATGAQYPLQILQSQNNGDIVFLLASYLVTPSASSSVAGTLTAANFAPLSGTNAPRLGETVIAISGTDVPAVGEGIIQKIKQATDDNGIATASSSISSFETSIDSSEMAVGSPLFDASGNILGIKTADNESGNFYPVGYLKSVIPAL